MIFCRFRRALALMLLIPTLALAEEPATGPAFRPIDLVMAYASPFGLTPQQIKTMEEKLLADPDDYLARVTLLGHYERQQHSPDQLQQGPRSKATQAVEQHILWLIEHHPDSPVLSLAGAMLDPQRNPEAYPKAVELWQQKIATSPEDAHLLGSAADFFQSVDRKISEDYLRRAKAIEPEEAEWSARLAYIYLSQLRAATGDERRKLAVASLAEGERALGLSKDHPQRVRDILRFRVLRYLASAAFEAGEMQKAEQYAQEVLKIAEPEPEDVHYDYDRTVRESHVLLGRLALRSGQVEKAKDHLLQSGQKPIMWPRDDGFRDMTLARELLAQGERDVVLEYLRRCSQFWTSDEERLQRWIEIIQGGGIPEFDRQGFE